MFYQPNPGKKRDHSTVNLSTEELFSIRQITLEEYKSNQGKKQDELMKSLTYKRRGMRDPSVQLLKRGENLGHKMKEQYA